MLPAQLCPFYTTLWMPSSYPPFAKYAKDGAPRLLWLLRFEDRATRCAGDIIPNATPAWRQRERRVPPGASKR